ncbi:MAG: DUF3880 domain-containing protein [bacterium]|nr:DUF3880 domain-containing protein [bacterium]
MKLLICEWNAYMQDDFEATLKKHHIPFRGVSYCFESVYEDEYFEAKFPRFIHEDVYDAVVTFNYFPLVAKVCHRENIMYIAWCYDNPLDARNVEDTLGYPTNRVFFFDKVQYLGYKNAGFDTAYHLPLAVSTDRLDALTYTEEDIRRFSSEISFVGKLYPSDLDYLMAPLSQPLKDVLLSMVSTQMKIYGNYFLNEAITDDLLGLINMEYAKTPAYAEHHLTREELSYALATQITRIERLTILGHLAQTHQVKMYSRENHPYLAATTYCGTAQYNTEMPKIFKLSKINLNINLKISQTGLPLRAIDILGAGGFLLTNYQKEYEEHFVSGRDIVIYDSIEDAVAKADYYLAHEEERARIAHNGYEIAKEHYSYEHLIAVLLQTVGLM